MISAFNCASLLFLWCIALAHKVEVAGNNVATKRRLKILVNNPAVAYSHMQFQGRLADVLTDAGHEVHVLTQQANPHLANHTGVSRGQRVIRVERPPERRDSYLRVGWFHNTFDGPRNMLHDGTMTSWYRQQVEQCEELLANNELLAALEAEHYDVGLSELYHVCAFGLFKRLKVPASVSSLAIGLNCMTAPFLGIPTIPSWATSMFNPSMKGAKMDFRERFTNFWLGLYDHLMMKPLQLALHQPLFESLKLNEVMRNVSLVFVNVNEFFELPRLISNKVIYVGGIVEAKAGQLSDKEKAILENSQAGVVLFSASYLLHHHFLVPPAKSLIGLDNAGAIGGNGLCSAFCYAMRLKMKKGFIEAFKQFPTYDFIWKHKVLPNETYLFSDAPNVHTLDWVHQKALLQHPKLRAFITHCGLNSINEAATAGVPVVSIPLFGDQLYNAALLVGKGLGVHLDIRDTDQARLIVEALKAVLHNPLYTDNARLLALKLRRSPFSPEEKLVKWVEFAAEYSDLNELNLPYAELNFIVYYSLDVIGATLVALIILGAVVYASLRSILKRLVVHLPTGYDGTKLKAS